MKLLTEMDLLAAGWPPGEQIPKLHAMVADLAAKGIHDRDYALKLLKRAYPLEDPRVRLRPEPAPLAEAIVAQNDLEAQNLGAARRTMQQLLRVPVVLRGALMPDACPAGHAEATIPVGGAIVTDRAIIPSAHSADICCSLMATFYRTEMPVREQLDALLRSTRFGQGGRDEKDWVAHPVLQEPVWTNPFLRGLERYAAMHLADQGDGNHFAYLGQVTISEAQRARLREVGHTELAAGLDAGRWSVLVTHHGSRGLGAHLFKRGQNAAEKFTQSVAQGIPEAACWLESDSREGRDYWEAMQYVSRWTVANHQCIAAGFLRAIGAHPAAQVGNEHNFVWQRGRHFFHGKGATPAWPDESGRPRLGLIPLNMAEPILLVLGKNQEQFLSFAPHGAGRNLSRRAMMKAHQKHEGRMPAAELAQRVAHQAPGLDIRWWHGKPDLSETPIAYKPATTVRAQIEQFGLAEIVAEIEPLGCIMAGDGGPRSWEKDDHLTPKQKRQIEHRATRRATRQSLMNWEEPERENEP
jgi:tRNA-splicing ligase RtcB (3'-phosphate/5'-hydroxy nucleic acid ligase)